MAYQSITNQILEVLSESNNIIQQIHSAEKLIKEDFSKKREIIDQCEILRNEWYKKCQTILLNNELLLEFEEFVNYPDPARHILGQSTKMDDVNDRFKFVYDALNIILNFIKGRKAVLLSFAKNIESRKNKEVVLLNIDDFDNFKDINVIKSLEVIGFSEDCFLEDDVENAFLKTLEEPYKELDGGAETRDLFSDRIAYKGKRLATVFMFKGRGQKGELTIKKAGSTGNQLLKLAKNNSAECFIVQHIHKINPDVREALQDHILQNTRLSKVYICFIDGIDTARFLKSVGENLEELKNKKHKLHP
ncbi:MAG: hypothetical protein KAH86_03865 [Methanosarcinales archaeon]|nr:hypothetical protein [Methanosarcinales archaeon]